MPRVSIDGQDLPRVLRATVVITHNVPEADPPPPAQPAPHHTHPDFWKQAAGDALARNVPLLLPGHHSPPSSALGDLLKLGMAAHEGAKEAAAQSPLPASQSSLPAAQRPHDPLQTPRAEFVLLLPLDHGVDIARWALAPMGPSRFHRVTLQTLDRFGTPKHTWIMFRAYVHAYREAEYTPRPADPADGRRYVEVTLRGLLPPLTAYDGQNLVVVAPGLADQTANALPALSSFEEPLLAQTQAATQNRAATQNQAVTGGGGHLASAFIPTADELSALKAAATAPAKSAPQPSCVLTVKVNIMGDSSKHSHQTIDNFGASDAWCIARLGQEWDNKPPHSSKSYLDSLADLLFSMKVGQRGGDGQSPDGIGLSLWRFNVGAGPPDTSRAHLINGLNADEKGNYLSPTWTQTECFYDSRADLQKPINTKKQQRQQKFLSLAYGAGVQRFVAFSNSPPCWLTVNGFPYSDEDQVNKLPTNLRPGNYGLFAEFLAKVVQHLSSNTKGAQWYVSPINEPDVPWFDNNQEGCRYDNTTIIQVIIALDNALRNAKVTAQVTGPEANNLNHLLTSINRGKNEYGSYINALLYPDRNPKYQQGTSILNDANKVAGILKQVGLAAHSYGLDVNGGPHKTEWLTVRQEIRKELGPKGYWMSEYTIRNGAPPLPLTIVSGKNTNLGSTVLKDNQHYVDNTGIQTSDSDSHGHPVQDSLGITAAIDLATLIHYDLTLAEASAWQWWTTISHRLDASALIHTTYNPHSDPDTFVTRMASTTPNIHYKNDDTPTILPTKMLWAFGNFSRFIRPTAQRVDITGQAQIASLMLSNPADPPGTHLLASAYLNHDPHAPNKLVIVLVNRGGIITIKKEQTICCNDPKMPHFKDYYVTSALDNLRHYAIDQSKDWIVPAQSVVTIVSSH